MNSGDILLLEEPRGEVYARITGFTTSGDIETIQLYTKPTGFVPSNISQAVITKLLIGDGLRGTAEKLLKVLLVPFGEICTLLEGLQDEVLQDYNAQAASVESLVKNTIGVNLVNFVRVSDTEFTILCTINPTYVRNEDNERELNNLLDRVLPTGITTNLQFR